MATRYAVPTGYLSPQTDSLYTLTDCSNLAGYNTGSSTAPSAWVTQDTTNVKFGTGSIHFQQTTLATTYRQVNILSQSWDLSKDMVVFLSIFMPYTSPSLTAMSSINVYLSNTTGMTTDRVYYALAVGKLAPGWNLIPVYRADWTANGGTFSWASTVQSCRFEFNGSASTYQDIVFDAIVVRRKCRSKVMIFMEDGFDSVYNTAFPITSAANIRMNHGVINSAIGTANYMTSSNIQTMYDAGDDVCVHDAATWYDQADPLARMSAQKAALLARGWTRGNDCAVYPSGEYGQVNGTVATFLPQVAAAGFRWAKTASTTRSTAIMPYNDHYNPLAHLPTIAMDNTVSLSTAKTRIDNALLHGGTVLIFGHKLDTAAAALTWATSDFQALIDYLVLKRRQGYLDVVTITQWLDGLTAGRVPTSRLAA